MIEGLPTEALFLAVVTRLSGELADDPRVFSLLAPPLQRPPFVLVSRVREEPDRTKSLTIFDCTFGLEVHWGDGDTVPFMRLRDRIVRILTSAPLPIADTSWRQLYSFPTFQGSQVAVLFDGDLVDIVSNMEFQVRISPK